MLRSALITAFFLTFSHLFISPISLLLRYSHLNTASFLVFSQFYSCLNSVYSSFLSNFARLTSSSCFNSIFMSDEALWAKRSLFQLFLLVYVINISVDFSGTIIAQARFGADAFFFLKAPTVWIRAAGSSYILLHRIFLSLFSNLLSSLCHFLL